MTARGREKCLVIGLGNPFRSDDGVGLVVAKELRKRNLPPSVEVVDGAMDELGLIELLGRAERVVIVDAVSMGEPPGTIRVIPLENGAGGPPPRNLSLHALGLAEVAALSASLGSRPSLVIVGIEPELTAPGEGLSRAVGSGIDGLVAEVLRVVNEECHCLSGRGGPLVLLPQAGPSRR